MGKYWVRECYLLDWIYTESIHLMPKCVIITIIHLQNGPVFACPVPSTTVYARSL